MLSRAICDALAAAYPEIRDHCIDDCDLLHPKGWYGDHYLPPMWAPRLDDLLEIAERLRGRHWLRLQQQPPACGGPWAFGRGWYQHIEDPACGATPAEAVARWLFAQRGGAG